MLSFSSCLLSWPSVSFLSSTSTASFADIFSDLMLSAMLLESAEIKWEQKKYLIPISEFHIINMRINYQYAILGQVNSKAELHVYVTGQI